VGDVKGFFCEKFAWNAGAGQGLAVSWTLCQFSRAKQGDMLRLPKPRCSHEDAAMNEITNWMQSNWYELGSLFAQFTFLFVGLWFAKKILTSMRATQQQFGALLRLSMTDGLEERPKMSEMLHAETSGEESSVVASSVLSPVMDRPTAPTQRATSYAAFERPVRSEAPSLSDELSGRANGSSPITSTPDPTPYVAAPLTLPADDHNGGRIAAAGRGVVQWLQTPMASSSASSRWKTVVRWLQAPAGN